MVEQLEDSVFQEGKDVLGSVMAKNHGLDLSALPIAYKMEFAPELLTAEEKAVLEGSGGADSSGEEETEDAEAEDAAEVPPAVPESRPSTSRARVDSPPPIPALNEEPIAHVSPRGSESDQEGFVIPDDGIPAREYIRLPSAALIFKVLYLEKQLVDYRQKLADSRERLRAAQGKLEVFEIAHRPRRAGTGVLAARENEQDFKELAIEATRAIDREARTASHLGQIRLQLEKYGLTVILIDHDQPTVVPDEGVFCTQVPVSLSQLYADLGMERDKALEKANLLSREVHDLKNKLADANRMCNIFYRHGEDLQAKLDEITRRPPPT